jgi:FlaA1/EpsC-like NDP-sugar epimerase
LINRFIFELLIFNLNIINFSKLNISRWIVFLIDLIIVIQTFILSYLVRFNFTLNFDLHQFINQIPTVILAATISFLLSGSYKGIVRHTTMKDAENVFKTSIYISVILALLVLFTRFIFKSFTVSIPLSIIIIHFLLNTTLLISSRFIFKYLFNIVFNGIAKKENILIFGVNETSISTEEALANNASFRYNILGFVSTKKEDFGKTIHGKKIFNLTAINSDFIQKHQIKELLIPTKSIANENLIQLTDKLLANNIIIKNIPPIDQWVNGALQLGQLKKVKIADLLNRDIITIINEKHKDFFANKTVLITGGAGSIGSEIVRQISNYAHKNIIVLDKSESGIYAIQQEFRDTKNYNINFEIADIRNKTRIESIFKNYKPNIVFHAAAYKHVPLMEQFPYEAISVNILGTQIIADLAIKYQAERFVMVSTDKAVRPTNVMGASKRFAEKYLLSIENKSKTAFITTRFGNVLASNGSVIPLFQKQIEKGGPLTVTHKDIERYFMTIPEACQLVIEAALMGENGKIFIFDMGESIKIYDIAKKVIQLSGLHYPEDIDIKITGLRPGEKLYEELFEAGENLQKTYHKKIMIANSNLDITSETIQKAITQLSLEKDNTNPDRIKQLLKGIVVDYVS